MIILDKVVSGFHALSIPHAHAFFVLYGPARPPPRLVLQGRQHRPNLPLTELGKPDDTIDKKRDLLSLSSSGTKLKRPLAAS